MLSRIASVLAVVALFVPFASAEVVPLLEVEWGENGEWYSGEDGTMTVTPGANGLFDFVGSYSGPEWDGQWSGSFDVDPILNFGMAITNNTAATQTFIATLTLPTVGAIAAPSTVLCGTSVTVTGLGPATAAAPAGDFVYRALVSGVFVGPPCDILPPPFSLSTPDGLPNAAGPFNFGPAPGPGLAAIDTIAIRHAITLTPGGTATINSTFIIVPEPGTLLMLLVGGAALARRRR